VEKKQKSLSKLAWKKKGKKRSKTEERRWVKRGTRRHAGGTEELKKNVRSKNGKEKEGTHGVQKRLPQGFCTGGK